MLYAKQFSSFPLNQVTWLEGNFQNFDVKLKITNGTRGNKVIILLLIKKKNKKNKQ